MENVALFLLNRRRDDLITHKSLSKAEFEFESLFDAKQRELKCVFVSP